MSDTRSAAGAAGVMTREPAVSADAAATRLPQDSYEEDGLASHPLWQDFLAEIEANRRAEREAIEEREAAQD